MRFLKLLLFLFILAPASEKITAQEAYEFIYCEDNASKQDSVIDFGATRPSIPIYRTVVLKNLSKDTLWLKDYVDDFFAIQNDPKYDETFREYSAFREDTTELFTPERPHIIIPPDSIFKMLVRFDARTSGPQVATGRKTGFLLIKLNLYPFTQVVQERTFYLTANKTSDLLAVRLDTVRFDSVYIGSASEKEWSVINASLIDVNTAQSFFPSTPEFIVLDTLRTALKGPSRNNPVMVRYTPGNRGLDSARIQADYILPDGFERDTISSVITGVGVEQQLDLVSAQDELSAVQRIDDATTPDNGDTVDIGDVRVGTAKRITLEFTSRGNLVFKKVDDIITNNSQVAGSIQKSFSTLGIGSTQTAVITLTPKQRETIIAVYTIESDIGTRVQGAPETALRRTIYFKLRGIEPVLSAASEISFPELDILQDCQRRDTSNFIITNTGNIRLRIQSMFIQSGVSGFILEQPFTQPVEVAPYGGQLPVKIIFTPNSIGLKTDTLIITSDNSQAVTKIPLVGSGVQQSEMSLSLPQDISVRPGTMIRIPIVGSAELLKKASRFEGWLDYDTTFLKPHFPEFVVRQGTASLGAAVEFFPETQVLKIISQTNFEENDTLAFLQFDSFLGNKLQTALSIRRESKFGTPDCPDASLFKTPAFASTSTVTLDSACGLNYKVGAGAGRFRFQSAQPSPSRERSEIQYEVAFPTNVTITMYDSYGRVLERPVNEQQSAGTYQVVIPTANLIPGVYFCEMRAGIYVAVQQIVVAE
jgi:hypothetical protein